MAQEQDAAADGFDAYADTYGDAVQRSIDFAGVEHDFFTRRKAEDLLRLARRLLGPPEGVAALDVGCGVGATDRHLVARLGELHGVDTAGAAIRRAEESVPGVVYRTYTGDRLPYPDGRFDLTFAICVLHHVPPPARAGFASELTRVVRPGGLVVVFEHNPFNPLTRLAVARCDFDEDAELLSPRRATELLEGAGLRSLEQRYVILFPSDRSRLRALEHSVGRLPLAAQFYVAARR